MDVPVPAVQRSREHAGGWRRRLIVVAGVIALTLAAALTANGTPAQTVGLFLNDAASFDGYTLFAPLRHSTAFLIDNEGRLIHTWPTGGSGVAPYLLDDGSIIRSGGNVTRRYTWEGDLIWNYVHPGGLQHHDIEVLPNGNVLMIVDEVIPEADAIAAGRDPANINQGQLEPVYITEIEPGPGLGGTIVWEWHSWDHLVQEFDATKANYDVVADHPELIDVNFSDPDRPPGEDDWHHANGIDYNPELDQIILSVRHVSELWVIDHSTTTAEAAGHTGGSGGRGGDLMYRWGNPAAYQAGDASDQQLYWQHDTQWIEPGLSGEGNILVFNNGNGRGYSSVDEIVPPVDDLGNYALTPGDAYGPTDPIWTYVAPDPPDFFSGFISGAQRLPNGNTLIDSGARGNFFEVLSDGTIVWHYVNPVIDAGPLTQGAPVNGNQVFRAYRYPADHPGLQGRDLTPGSVIELPLDSDSDGCGDDAELNTTAGSETTGGMRQPKYHWDFYDVWTHPAGSSTWTKDKVITIIDVLAVGARFGSGPALTEEEALAAALIEPVDDFSYHPAYDRGPIVGANHWDRAPADGSINVVHDMLGIALQFGHNCA